MEQIIQKSPQNLYEEGLVFKKNNDYNNYHMYMIMAANYNHELAIKELYDDYQNTKIHTKQDLKITKPFYELTEQYSWSLNYLGYIYQMSKDTAKSIEYYTLSYKLGNPVATCNLGSLYYNGNKVSKDVIKAISLLTKSSEQGCGIASLKLGEIYQNNQDTTKIVNTYELSILQGNLQAISHLGTFYYNKQDYFRAANIFEFGYIKGDIISTLNLLNCYYIGKGVKQNHNTAKELAEKVYNIDNSNIFAIEYLGLMYMNGEGCSSDWARAKEYYEIGVRKDSVCSMFQLAYILREPGGDYEVDFNRARELYELIIEKNLNNEDLCDAYINLASMYSLGQGVPANSQKMVEYYELAINQGSIEAMKTLGCLYYDNVTMKEASALAVEQNYTKARELFEMALEKDKSELSKELFYLGEIYHKGKGVDIDLILAMHYYEQYFLKSYCFSHETEKLVDVYKQLIKNNTEQVTSDHILGYLINIKKTNHLRDIYGYSYPDIEIMVNTYKLKREKEELIKIINELQGSSLIKKDANNDELKVLINELPGGKEKMESIYELQEKEKKEKEENGKCIIC